MPDTNKESSLLFSIGELERLERERVRAEQAVEESRRIAAEARRVERVRAAQQEEARRIEEAEARRTALDRERRDEEARRIALERAAVERVRAEVQARSEKELAEARRAHDLELARHRALAVRSRYRWIALASLAVTALVGALATTLSMEVRGSERLAEERSAALARERDAHRRATTDLAGATARLQALEAELASLRTRPEPRDPPPKPPRPPLDHSHHGDAVPNTTTKCTGDGDPLNGCLN